MKEKRRAGEPPLGLRPPSGSPREKEWKGSLAKKGRWSRRRKRDQALSGMEAGLREREGNPLQGELDAALRRLGEVTMENELLWRRVREKAGPLARRRSSKRAKGSPSPVVGPTGSSEYAGSGSRLAPRFMNGRNGPCGAPSGRSVGGDLDPRCAMRSCWNSFAGIWRPLPSTERVTERCGCGCTSCKGSRFPESGCCGSCERISCCPRTGRPAGSPERMTERSSRSHPTSCGGPTERGCSPWRRDGSGCSWPPSIARAIGPSPVVALVLWSDTGMRKHLRTLIEELHGAFGDAIDVVVVSSDEPSFSALSEEAGAAFIGMNLRSLCGGLAVHYADLQTTTEKRCVLPTSSGAHIEIKSEDRLWLSEDLELVHRSIAIAGDDNDGPKEYRMGADISWRNLHLRHDCDRDITLQVRTQVEIDLKKRQTVRINLYHEPGGGGTTVGRRIAWDLHNIYPVGILNQCAPRETAERIGKISALTESSVLIIVDGGQHSEWEIDDLYELLKANQTPAVLMQVLRRFSRQTVGRRQFWLDATLTDQEADRFSEAYATAVSAKKTELASLAKQRNDPHRTAFFFGLTAFGQDFRGLRQYVAERTTELTDTHRHILVYIAMAHYYGQQSIPAQAFASFLKLPRSKTLDLTAAFTGPAAVALGLLIQNQQAEWRTTHHLVAQKIMQQILAPANSLSPEDVWHQNLSSWGKDFANFCHGDKQATSDRFIKLVRRVLIYRDNIEVLGTERAAQRQFAQLIDDIPSPHGRREIFRHLTDRFPLEAHFHAHFARFLSLNGEYDEALRCMDSAISLQPEDHVLHHMRGMVLRRRIKGKTEAKESVEHLIRIAREASESFGKAREWGPDREHAYISEVQMLIDLIDQVGRQQQGSKKDVIRDVLTRSNADPFLQQALQKAEELLDRVQHLYAGERPSTYAIECRAKLENLYGDYPTALQTWDNLLSRPEVAKPPVRRQIVWTTLRRRAGAWDQLTRTETARIQQLLEENLEEESQDSTSLRLWLRAIRQLQSPPSLDSIIEKVSYWKANTGALDAAYYLYVLHTLLALEGSSQSASDAEQTLDECRNLARFRRDRTKSFEWIGPGEGVRGLVHQSRLGEWSGDFWESTDAITRCQGRIKEIGGPQKGKIEIGSSIGAFFVPGKSGIHAGRDENSPVNFYLGFSYDGPRAWAVQRILT